MTAVLLLGLLLGTPPIGWIPHPGPGPDFDGDRVCANHSRRAWVVEAVGDRVRVSSTPKPNQDPLPFPISFQDVLPQPPPPPPQPRGAPAHPRWSAAEYAERHARRAVVAFRDGWLVGFDGGEYGGSLWWYASSARGGVKLSSENVLRLLPIADQSEVLVVVGIAHMGIDKGQLLRFRYLDGVPHLIPFVDLGTKPQVVLLEPTGAVLVLTNEALQRIQPGGSVTTLCTVEYSGLYPTSMAVLPSGEIYVGMRHYLGSLNPVSSGACVVNWLVPVDCPRFIGRGDAVKECACGR
jgi:hypothetical protein